MLPRIIKFEEMTMTLRDNSFVANPEYISGVKSPVLQKLLKLGSCASTPIEKKATFNFAWVIVDGIDVVRQVTFYAPGAIEPSQIINLDGSNYITIQQWYRMMRPVWEYPEFIEEYNEKERIRELVKSFEYAAKRHGQMQQAVALGDADEKAAYESGKLLKTCREELYKELGV
ncbi:hypothetical protein [Yersinia phage vB_YenM_P8]